MATIHRTMAAVATRGPIISSALKNIRTIGMFSAVSSLTLGVSMAAVETVREVKTRIEREDTQYDKAMVIGTAPISFVVLSLMLPPIVYSRLIEELNRETFKILKNLK